jgi:hypothetical protein
MRASSFSTHRIVGDSKLAAHAAQFSAMAS